MSEHEVSPDRYGFRWGPMTVTRLSDLNPARDALVLGITTDAGQEIEVYVSGKGRSLRVFGRGKSKRGEWR